ncbi:MAG: hypothetical protein PHI18_06960 [bacterium]|nr:hypothetical protein [bacterium]
MRLHGSFYMALGLMCAFALLGCGKKPAPPSASGVILAPGTGAVLVQFDRMEDFRRDDWLALIHLQGGRDTKTLRRIPLADLQSVLVLDVEPGRYRVVAQAWTRKHPPASGGTLDDVPVEAGQVTILRAQPLGAKFTAEPKEPLRSVGNRTWTLRSDNELPDFVSEMLQQTEKG